LLQAQVQLGAISHIIPDVGADGQRFYHLLGKDGQEVGQLDVNAISQFMQHTSVGGSWKDDGQGNFQFFPVTRTTGPAGVPAPPGGQPSAQGAAPAALPTKATSGGPANRPSPSSTVMMVGTMPNGVQVAGTPQELKGAGVTNFTKAGQTMSTQIQQARNLVAPGGLFDAVEKDLSAFTPEELNGIGNRWQEFRLGSWIPQLFTGKGADPRYVKLRTDLNGLDSTAVMQVHVGQRGGQYMGEHFEDLANAKKFTFDNLKTAVGQERQYIEHRAMKIPKGSAASPSNPKGGVTAETLLNLFPPPR